VFIGFGGLIGLFLLLVIAVALSDDQDTTAGQNEELKEEEKKEEKKEEKQSGLVELSGSGDQVTEAFGLSGGLATFRSSYQNQSPSSSLFQVRLIDRSGREMPVGLIANEAVRAGGTAQPSKGLRVNAGEYRLNVQADGPWTVTIEQ
jgi:hypothetical protein